MTWVLCDMTVAPCASEMRPSFDDAGLLHLWLKTQSSICPKSYSPATLKLSTTQPSSTHEGKFLMVRCVRAINLAFSGITAHVFMPHSLNRLQAPLHSVVICV